MEGEKPDLEIISAYGGTEHTSPPDDFLIKDKLNDAYSALENLLSAEVNLEDPDFLELWREINIDNELISDTGFLHKLKNLTFKERLYILKGASSSYNLYISAQDFDSYFDFFPEDAILIMGLIIRKDISEDGDKALEEIPYLCLGSGVFEAASKRLNGGWDYAKKAILSQYRDVPEARMHFAASQRRKLAKDHLFGDYKKNFRERFEPFGTELKNKLVEYLQNIEDLHHGKYGDIEPDFLLKSAEFTSLPKEDQRKFLIALIAECQNQLVFNEVYNSGFGFVSEGGEVMGQAERGGGYRSRGLHSIIFETSHKTKSFSREIYHDYDPTYESGGGDESGFEQTIEASIKLLGTIGDSESVETVIDFWNKNRDPAYGPAIAETISEIDPDRGVAKILSEIKIAKESDQIRLLSLLYRLELGQIGISERGVHYLGRLFDVGVTDGFVSRLTADGKVGVFDKLKQLIGVFQLEADDFTGDRSYSIKKILQEITIEMLFIPRPDESEEDKKIKLELLEDFGSKYFQTYIELFSTFEEESGLRFNNLSLPEQGFVLKFLNDHNENDPKRSSFLDFIKKYGEDGFRAFRSIEFDPSAGEKLIQNSEEMTEGEMKELLKLFSLVYKTAEETAVWIKKVLYPDKTENSPQDLLEINIIREQILSRAVDALLRPEPDRSSKDRYFSGERRLSMIYHDLKDIVTLEPNTENFTSFYVVWVINKYLVDSRSSGEALSLSEQVISDGLANLYNSNEFSLRDYEGRTSDTSKSIEMFFRSLEGMRSQESTGDPKELLVYDIGAGDGRIAIPLALAGCRVVGIDNSERMVADSKKRPHEFIRALRGGEDDHLVRSTKDSFEALGMEISDQRADQIPEKIDIRQGNFFDFGADQFREEFGERQPDVIIIMWHTLGFAGDLEKMKQVLRNAYEILRPGGRICIEMPDRNFGGYGRAIRDFHSDNPDLPFGVIKDAPSKSGDSPTEQDEEMATWRYFPSNSEVLDALMETGFDTRDTHTPMTRSYFVQADAGEQSKLLIKENMFVATKPINMERILYSAQHKQNEVAHTSE